MTEEPQLDILPKLPHNARLIFRMNACYDWCACYLPVLSSSLHQLHQSPVPAQGNSGLGVAHSGHRRGEVQVFCVHEQLGARPLSAVILAKHDALDAAFCQPSQGPCQAGRTDHLLRR